MTHDAMVWRSVVALFFGRRRGSFVGGDDQFVERPHRSRQVRTYGRRNIEVPRRQFR